MNIIKHELRLYLKSTITWILSLIGVMIMFVSIFPAFKGSIGAMNTVLESFPEALKKMLGLTSMDMSNVIGFFGFMFMYITLIGAIQAMNLGLSLLSNEQRDKTADFLIAKPVKRINVVTAKLATGLIYIVITDIVFYFASLFSLLILGDSFDRYIHLLFVGSLLFVQLFFLCFGMFISVFMDKMKTVIPISLGVVFGFFVLNMLNESIESRPLSAFTPFAYFNTSNIYESSSFDAFWLILCLALTFIFGIGAYIKYIKKDIPSV